MLIGGAAVGAYVLLPQFLDEAMKPGAAEMTALKTRVAALEGFVDEAKKAREAAALPSDADISAVVDQVNQLLRRAGALETGTAALEERLAAAEERFTTSLDTTASSFLSEVATLREEISAAAAGARDAREARLSEIVAKIDTLDAHFVVENVRTYLLKAKSDLLAENLGNAGSELKKARTLFASLASSSVWERPAIRSMQGRLERLEQEIREDPATSVTRLDLLWNDLGRVLRSEGGDETPAPSGQTGAEQPAAKQ